MFTVYASIFSLATLPVASIRPKLSTTQAIQSSVNRDPQHQCKALFVLSAPPEARAHSRQSAAWGSGSALRSARLPVNLIGSPINYASRLIGSPITSQSTGSGLRDTLQACMGMRIVWK